MDLILPTAYSRLSEEGRKIVDFWLEHGNKKEVSREMGWGKLGTRVQRYLENPLIQEALLERQHLYQPMLSRIADSNEVMEKLTDLMRHGRSDEIQLKAAKELAKRYHPQEINVNVRGDFNERKRSLFEALDHIEDTVEVHR